MSFLTDTRWSAPLFAAALFLLYAVVPAVVNTFILRHPHFLELAGLTALACASILGGFYTRVPVLDSVLRSDAKLISVPSWAVHAAVWGCFLALLVVTLATADAIPLITAIKGAAVEELNQQRGAFLKMRSGWQAVLPYAAALLGGAFLPYSLALLFIERSRFRFAALGLLMVYSVSYLQRALFLQMLVPVFYVFARQKKVAVLLSLAAAAAVLLALNFTLAKGLVKAEGRAWVRVASLLPTPPETAVDPIYGAQETSYFGARYQPAGTIDQIVWRAFAVPVFSAADALRVFHERMDGGYLKGATSTPIAWLTGRKRVPFEREVHEYQWGPNPFASANVVYIVEAFVNFGILGVVLISFLVGQALRWFDASRDEAFKAMWPVFAYFLFIAGFFGTMLSNGFLVLFAAGFLVSVRERTH